MGIGKPITPTAMNTKPILRCTAALAALAVLACSKDDTAEPGTPDTSGSTTPFTITATMDDASETRVTATDDGSSKIELKWKTGDKIYVVNSAEAGTTTAGTLYKFTCGNVSSDGKTAAFTCTNYPADATPAYAIHQEAVLIAYFDPTAISFSTSTCTSKLSTLLNNYPLWACNDPETRLLKFKPFNAVLKLNITLPAGASGTLSNMRIGSADGARIFRYGSYDITSGEAVPSGNTMENFINGASNSSFTENTEKSVYLPVRPGTELSGQTLEIDLLVGNSVYTATIRGAKLEAGKCYPLTLGAGKWSLVGNICEGGTGAAESPFEMANETNLRTLARAVRTGQVYNGKYFKLTGDISGIQTSETGPWLPIGTSSSTFYGNFDGGNHSVGGTFYLSDKDGDNLGFFGCISGNISNLTLKGDVICNYNGSSSSGIYLGGIAGWSIGSRTITGCTRSDGTITVNAPNATVYVGGIVGYQDQSSSEMHTCRNECDITVTGNRVVAGALVGYNRGKVFSCSTFLGGLKITVNGTQRNPVKAIGTGNAVDETEHTD